eukprot:12899776-Prorocentrum_lima.AAC.1
MARPGPHTAFISRFISMRTHCVHDLAGAKLLTASCAQSSGNPADAWTLQLSTGWATQLLCMTVQDQWFGQL